MARKAADRLNHIVSKIEDPMVAIKAGSDLMRFPSHRAVHTLWLMAKAGFTELSMKPELEILGIPGVVMRAFRRRSAYWMPAKTVSEKNEYERRARKALVLEKNGQIELHDPIPHDESVFMGNWQQVFKNLGAVPHDPTSSISMGVRQGAVFPEDGTPRVTSIQGMPLPDIMRTIHEAEEAGVGMRDMILKISEMVSADLLAMPDKKGTTFVPIGPNVKRLKMGDTYFIAGLNGEPVERKAYDDGVVVAGCFYDQSYIVPDRTTRTEGLRLAKQILGNNDLDHLKKISEALKATAVAEKLDDMQRERIKSLEAEIAAQLDPTKEVKGGISMTRPKIKSPEEFNKGKV